MVRKRLKDYLGVVGGFGRDVCEMKWWDFFVYYNFFRVKMGGFDIRVGVRGRGIGILSIRQCLFGRRYCWREGGESDVV